MALTPLPQVVFFTALFAVTCYRIDVSQLNQIDDYNSTGSIEQVRELKEESKGPAMPGSLQELRESTDRVTSEMGGWPRSPFGKKKEQSTEDDDDDDGACSGTVDY